MSSVKNKTRDKNSSGWKRALGEAERQIALYKRKIHELNGSVRIMQEKIASGAPWPGQLDGQKSEQQHSV
jgi:hypothetical protein